MKQCLLDMNEKCTHELIEAMAACTRSRKIKPLAFQHGGWRGQEPLPLAKELLTFMNSRVDNQFSL